MSVASDRKALIEGVRSQALKWEHKLKGWGHVKFMNDQDLERLIGPKVSTVNGAVNSVYAMYIRDGEYKNFEPSVG